MLEIEKGMEENIQNSIPEELRIYNEFTELEKNADQMIDKAYAELEKEYSEGHITDEEYLEASENLEKNIAQLKEQLNKQRAFYNSAGVTGPENIEHAARFKTNYQYKLLYMLLTAYEYLPQNYSIFSFEYDTNFLKNHSGDILTFSWDITVTNRVPVGRFYFNPLLSYTTGIRTLTMVNKNPVWRGQEIRVIGSSPFRINLQDSVDTSDPLSVYRNYKKYIPNTTVYRPITINYLDENKEIIKTLTINQSEYRYETKPEKIYGYELMEIPSNASGIMPNHPLSVNYGYRLKNSSVITEYLDTHGNTLYDSEIIEGKVFDQYNTEPKQIYGYEIISLPDNQIGKMTEEITKVVYIYQLKKSSVTVNYLDDEGNPIAESKTINGKVFDHYETSAKEIYGYRLTGTPVNAVGELMEEPITVYGKISDPVKALITVKVQSLKCNVSVAKQDSETNTILDGAAFKVQQWSYNQNKYVDLKNLAATEYNGSRRYTASGLEYTDDNGGWFRIAETGAPNGYELKPAFVPGGSYTSTAPGEFRLTEDMNGKTFSFTVKDPPQKGTVEVIKDAEDNFKEGHKFKLTGTSTIGRTISMTDATDKNGRVRFENVYIGSGYTLEEIETGIQYVVPPSQSVSVKWNEVTQKCSKKAWCRITNLIKILYTVRQYLHSYLQKKIIRML